MSVSQGAEGHPEHQPTPGHHLPELVDPDLILQTAKEKKNVCQKNS